MAGRRKANHQTVTVWKPQAGPQWAFVQCPCFEVFFGGSRGGGKTDAVLGEFAIHAAQYAEHAIGLMVRRRRTELVETIERSKALYGPLGAVYTASPDNLWRFPNGARLRFAYLERDADAENYQGHSYSRVYVEEIGNFPRPEPILKLMATLRSGAQIPVGFRATGNPGGPGHAWVKARYIDPAPLGWEVLTTDYDGVQRDRVYIPSRVTDNAFLGKDYVANLQMSGSPELVRAWLDGDWSVVFGAYFPEFETARHVVTPFAIPGHWLRFRAGDWGSAAPFVIGWYAVSDGHPLPDGRSYPAGALIKYREWYGGSAPNVGLQMTAEEVADGIRYREQGEQIKYGVLDPACWKTDGGPSIAERMLKRGVTWQRADNSRLAGWDQLRARLKGEAGDPRLFFFSTCPDTIRTIPALQHDDRNPEDVDSDGDDHAGDETRYSCMSRPWTVKLPEKNGNLKGSESLTFNQLVEMSARARRREE